MSPKPIFTATTGGGMTSEFQKQNDGRIYWRIQGSSLGWFDGTDGALSAFSNSELAAIAQARGS